MGACAAAVSALGLGLVVACGPDASDAPGVSAMAPAHEAPRGAAVESAQVPGSATAPEPAPEGSVAPDSPSRAAASAPAPEGDALAPEPMPLEVLLRVPVTTLGEEAKRPSALDAVEPPPVAPQVPSAGPSWRDRIQVERRSEAIGPAGPRQGAYSETEAGVRVPVDDRVSIEGGVRVDQRDEPGQESPERKSSPRVELEVRF